MNPSPAETNPARSTAWYAFAVAAVTLACFWSAISADFVRWDDDINIYRNAHIKGLTRENLQWMFTDLTQTLRYKPLTWLAWAAIHEVAGLKPATFHLANILFHAANAVLVFLLFSAMIRTASVPHQAFRITLCAAVGALTWSLHPLRVEPVAWASGLPYTLALMFALGSLNLYWRFATDPETRTRDSWAYRGSLVCFFLALLTYPIITGLAITPVAIDWWLARQRNQPGPWLRARHLPFLIGSALLLGVNVLGRLIPNPVFSEAGPLPTFSILDLTMRSFYLWTYFLVRHVWTADLSMIYYVLVGFDPLSWPFVVSAVFVVAVSVTLFGLRHRRPELWLVWACHLVWLFPVLGLTEKQYSPSDRYTYASGILVALLVASGLYRLAASDRWRLGMVGAGAGLILFAWQSSVLLPNWHDTEHLFRHAILLWQRDNPSSALRADELTDEFISDFGVALVVIGQVEAAEKQFAEAVRLAPANPRHRHNWALTLKRLGRDTEGAAQEAEAQRLAPPSARSSGPPAK